MYFNFVTPADKLNPLINKLTMFKLCINCDDKYVNNN